MTVLQGILTPSQREMGFALVESDHCVSLMRNGQQVAQWDALTVTLTKIKREAYQAEQWIKSEVLL